MNSKNPYELDFEEYIRQSEPGKTEKTYAWITAIGLQQVDGLTPSKYLYDTAIRNIEGELSLAEAVHSIDNYYESKSSRTEDETRTEEADKVSSRIAQILGEKSFNFSPAYLISLHKRLFVGIFKFAGKIRDYDITKNEWVLNGDTVTYGSAFELKATLDYDFEQERNFKYRNLSIEEIVKHITFFVSRLWQIHAFGEGNTRTTAVFIIKYLRSLGFDADNKIFSQNSWYFRNALVRANYNDLQNGVHENSSYLEAFFRNLLMKEANELKNRYLHLDYNKITPEPHQTLKKGASNAPESSGLHQNNARSTISCTVNAPETANLHRKYVGNCKKHTTSAPEITKIAPQMHRKSQRLHNNCPSIAERTLNAIFKNPKATTIELAAKLGISVRTVKNHINILKKEGILVRDGANKNGTWKVAENRKET